MINEILNYAVHRGARDCHIKINEVSNKDNEIIMTFKPLDLSITELNELRESLDIPRQVQVEEYSWELVGENEYYHELNMIGMMTDEASVEYNDNCLKVKLYRKG